MMTIKNNRPVIVGMFILLGLAILVVTLFTLGGEKKTFVKSFTLNAVFTDVNGLLKGANILYSGVKVGTVKKISLYNCFVLFVINLPHLCFYHLQLNHS